MAILICDEHSAVLPEWWSRRFQDRTVVYLDAHLDLQFVSADRLNRLLQCTSLEMFRRCDKSHYLSPNPESSYSIEDFLYPASKLGIISRLVWVAPPHVEIGYSQAAIDQLQQIEAVSCCEIESFEWTSGGWIEGSLLELPITICRYEQLGQLTLPANALIDIDIDFFITVPGDVAWVNPRIVFDALERLPIRPDLVTLSRSVNSGFTPLRYRFLADYLLALWERRHQDAEHYERLFHLEQRMQSCHPISLVSELRRELESYPQCAACYDALSRCEQDPELARQLQSQAARICEDYQSSPLRTACGYLNRPSIPCGPSAIESLQRTISDGTLSPAEADLTRIALGLLYCSQGQLESALTLYQSLGPQRARPPELSLEIGKQLVATQPDRAIRFLQMALDSDKTRSAAHVYLSYCYRSYGSLHEAIRHLEIARTTTPAWNQLLLMLAAIHDQLGDHRQSRLLQMEYNERQFAINQLARRLNGPRPQSR